MLTCSAHTTLNDDELPQPTPRLASNPMQDADQSSFLNTFPLLCARLLAPPKPAFLHDVDTWSGIRLPLSQASRYLAKYYSVSVNDWSHSHYAPTRPQALEPRLHRELATLLHQLRQVNAFALAERLERLLQRLGFGYRHGGLSSHGDTETECNADGISDSTTVATLWMLLRLNCITDATAIGHLSKVSTTLLNRDSSSIGKLLSLTGPTDANCYDADAAQDDEYPYFATYTPEALNLQEIDVAEKYDFVHGPSRLMKGRPRVTHYEQHKARTMYGAFMHPRRAAEEFWNLNVHVQVPPLPVSPQDVIAIACSAEHGDVTQWRQSMEAGHRKSICCDADEETTKEFWVSASEDQDFLESPLRSWEQLSEVPIHPSEATKLMFSPYLTEASCLIMDAVYSSHFSHPFDGGRFESFGDSEELLHDILNLLIGVPSTSFELVTEQLYFRVSPARHGRLRTKACGVESFESYISKFLAIGTHIVRLEAAVDLLESDVRKFGQVGFAFAHALSSYISFARACMVTVRDTLKDTRNCLELLSLDRTVGRVHLQLQEIASICRCDLTHDTLLEGHLAPRTIFRMPCGAELLSCLYQAICALDMACDNPHGEDSDSDSVKAVLVGFLSHSCRPYLAWLDRWLGLSAPPSTSASTGLGVPEEVSDPYEEFFISCPVAENRDGDSFWSHGWQFKTEGSLPAFLSPDVARDVLQAGKYLRLLRSCIPDHPLASLTSRKPISTPTFSIILAEGDVRPNRSKFDRYIASLQREIALLQEQRDLARKGLQGIDPDYLTRHREKFVSEHYERQRKREEVDRERKRAVHAEIQEFLTERAAIQAMDRKRERALEEERLEKEKVVEARRRTLVEEMRQEMLQEHSARMAALDAKGQAIEQQLSNLTLNANSKADHHETNVSTTDTDTPKVDVDHARLNARENLVNTAILTPELMVLPDAGQQADELDDDVPGSPRSVSGGMDSIAVQTIPVVVESTRRYEGDQLFDSSKDFDTKLPLATKNQTEVPLPQPCVSFENMQCPSLSMGAWANRDSAPTFSHMGSNLLTEPNFSRFFAPGFRDQESAPVAAYDGDWVTTASPGPVDPVSHAKTTDTTEPTLVTRAPASTSYSTSSASPGRISDGPNSDASSLTVEDRAISGAPYSRGFSFPQFLEQLAEDDSKPASGLIPFSALTGLTLHYALSSISSFISRATMQALCPGLLMHLRIAGRYLLLRDGCFVSKLQEACFEAHIGLELDGRPDLLWPPGIAEITAAMDGVLPAELDNKAMDGEVGQLEFVEGTWSQNPSDLTALSFLKLNYAAPYPYNIVLTQSAAKRYDEIFHFTLCLLRTARALDKVCQSSWWLRSRVRNQQKQQRKQRIFVESSPGRDTLTDEEDIAAQRMYWEARMFVNGLLRYTHEVAINPCWESFLTTLTDAMSDSSVEQTSLEDVYRWHFTTLERIRWRLLLKGKQRPVMVIIEKMLQQCINLSRWINGKSVKGKVKTVAEMLVDFRLRLGLLVKLLRGMSDQDINGPTTAMISSLHRMPTNEGKAVFSLLLDEIDANGYIEEQIVPNLSRLNAEHSNV
ncbi:Spc98 family-domain-containing protein [Gaertneriomyces semiglobifer]|nr:Spc98 family-domain-containing protein [Gaertneriomyces semiglobifer]